MVVWFSDDPGPSRPGSEYLDRLRKKLAYIYDQWKLSVAPFYRLDTFNTYIETEIFSHCEKHE